MASEQFIPVNEPLLDGNEGKYLQECIETGWISSEGPFVSEFEKNFSESLGVAHGVAVTNGTAALDVAIAALGVGPGDEVVLPTFTIISCILEVIRSGATPVLVDCNPRTWNMDVAEVERKLTPRTKVILAVHIYGLPVDMDPLVDLANRRGIAVIEDAAEAIGQTYRGRPCGSLGELSTFSFYPNKHVTSGEGGMVVTCREDLAAACRSLRNLCFQSEKRFVHERLGWNLRMTNMQAAIGLAQLEKLPRTIEKKRAMGARYTAALKDIDGLQLPVTKTDYATNSYWVFGLVLEPALHRSAAELMEMLRGAGIGTRPFFCPMHMQPVLKRMGYFHDECYPNAERIYEYGLYLPSGMALMDHQIDRVSETVRKLVA